MAMKHQEINAATARSPIATTARPPIAATTRPSVATATMLSAIALAALAGCRAMPTISVGLFPRTPIPAEIAAPAGQRLGLIAEGKGVQLYRCDAKAGSAGAYEWTLQSPEATLRDPAGKYLGKLYAGPTWEAIDGSKIIGTIDARRDAQDRSWIPWLRLNARSTGGPGLFSGVRTVLRVATFAGGTPAIACNDIERGRIVRVDYTADYYFYVDR